jgi:glycerol-3-phosphate dehydrogenase
MKIGIIGAGNLGTGLAKRLLAKRHSVVLSYSRDVSKLEIGTNTSAGEETAALVPTGQVVKAIPPFAEVLHSNSMDVGGARLECSCVVTTKALVRL